MKNITKSLFVFTATICVLFTTSRSVAAEVRHPHPTYIDTWEFGITNDGWAYSNYYLEAPVRLGSRASVTDAFGNIKSSAQANYGWARAGAKKQWNWVQAKSYYGWYWF